MSDVTRIVEKILTTFPVARNSDKALVWLYWEYEGHLTGDRIDWSNFLNSTSPESITRARRLVQAKRKDLRATRPIMQNRRRSVSESHRESGEVCESLPVGGKQDFINLVYTKAPPISKSSE